MLASNGGIAVLLVLLTIEIAVDKIPGLDHVNDLIQSVIRPAAGAILAMAATSQVDSINPLFAMLLGLIAAGSVHAAKATTRPAITLTTGGLGNPLVSIGEDIIAALSSVVAIFAPLLVLVFLVTFLGFLIWAGRRLRRWRSPRAADPVSTTLRQ
jgi:hypothetical protein